MANLTVGSVSDSARDARRYHKLLLALSTAIETVQAIERSTPRIDMLLDRLMPDLAEALNARHAFVALLREDGQQADPWFEFTAVWPRSELVGQRLAPSSLLIEVACTGKVKVIDPLGEMPPAFIPGLEAMEAVSAVLARMQTKAQTRIVGICNQRNPAFGPYLAVDGMALDSIVELVALGVRSGERRRRELDGIQETSTVLLTVLDLQEVLSIIVERAARVFDVPATSVMLWDRMREAMVVRDSWGLPEPYKENHRLPSGLVQRLATSAGRFHSMTGDALREHPIGDERLLEAQQLYEVLRTPLTMAGQLIGYLSIYDREAQRSVTPEEIELTEIFAGQAALAVHRAELYEAIMRRSQHWQALHEASKAITEGFAGDGKSILDRIIEQAVESISGAHGPKANFGVIQLLDQTTMELTFESVYPADALPHLKMKVGERRAIGAVADQSTRIGITGRTVLSRQAQRVDSVAKDPDYLGFNASTQSELSVPLIDGEHTIGVLSLESDEIAAFDEDDEKALTGLADMAVIVMKNQKQTEQLNRTHAVALMGAWSADVAHDTVREIGAIRRAVYLANHHEGLATQVRDKLMEIDRAADTLFSLQYLPQAPDLSMTRSESKALLDEIVCQEVEGLRRKYPNVQWSCEPSCAGIWIQMHEQWLRRVVRHLAHNAGAAVASKRGQAAKRVILRTASADGMAEVQVEDSGPGVAHAVKSLLFRQPVFRPDGSQGRGLLLIRFVLEQHGGTADLVWSRQGEGACFAFQAPVFSISQSPARG
jgi:GAF domain-containing protein